MESPVVTTVARRGRPGRGSGVGEGHKARGQLVGRQGRRGLRLVGCWLWDQLWRRSGSSRPGGALGSGGGGGFVVERIGLIELVAGRKGALRRGPPAHRKAITP